MQRQDMIAVYPARHTRRKTRPVWFVQDQPPAA
jgi:hypothetical protein